MVAEITEILPMSSSQGKILTGQGKIQDAEDCLSAETEESPP